jgi:hypothetical protein
MCVRVGDHLPVKRVCPHLQAEHRFDVCPSGCGALSGMLSERHGVPVTLFDLASNAFAQQANQLVGRSSPQRPPPG